MPRYLYPLLIITIIVIASIAAFVLTHPPTQDMRRATQDGRIRVITTLFPLYDMAKAIGGGDADVTLLLPPGIEPHSFEPTPGDLVKINQADIFIYTDDLMEPWAKDILAGQNNQNLKVVNSSQGVTLANNDPHIWLDFANAKIMATDIADAFIAKDPAHKNAYDQALAAYQNKLDELDSAYRSGLANCTSHEIVYGGHYAFGYLAKRYGLTYLAAQGVAPDAEPTAQDLVALVNQIKSQNIKYVFYEELTSPKISDTLAAETNAKLLLLNAAHNVSRDDMTQGTTFFDILNKDLANLKIGLGCQ